MTRIAPMLALLAGCQAGVSARTCLDEAAPGQVFEVAPSEEAPQIHATSALSPEGLWVSWSGPGGGSNFHVFTAHLRCDGTIDQDPERRSTGDAGQLDSALAVDAEGTAMVVWQADTSQSEPETEFNLSTWVDVHTGEGFSGARQVALQRSGTTNEGQAWMPALTARRSDGFALAGSWSHADTEVFRAYVQPLDAAGEPTADASDLFTDDGAGQLSAQLAEDGERRLHFVWETLDADSEVNAIWRAASDPRGAAAVNRAPLGEGSGADVSASGDAVWFAWADPEGRIQVESLDGVTATLGSGVQNFVPSLAANSDGGVTVAWFENQAGSRAAIRLERLDAEGVSLTTGSLDSIEVAPYPFDVTRIDDDLVFVAYHSGPSVAESYVRGELVDLSD